MTSQEAYKILCEVCDKAEKYDKMINVLQEIRQEIVKLPVISLNKNDVYKADVLEIIDKHIKEYVE